MAVAPITGKVAGSRRWAESLYSLRIDADIDPFEAGQFGRIGLCINGENVMRPYSFVNAAGETPLEFYYSIVPGGPLSARLAALAQGDEILINKKANGFLVLSQVPPAEQLWMMSTGTGLGPFLSILKGEKVWQTYRKVILVHAVRHAADLSYGEEIDALLQKQKSLIYAPFVSREKKDGALPGRIPAALANGALAEFTGVQPSPEQSQFMLCGNPQMVKDATAVLQDKGFRRNRRREPGHITMENYW